MNRDQLLIDAQLAAQGLRRASSDEAGWDALIEGHKVWATDANAPLPTHCFCCHKVKPISFDGSHYICKGCARSICGQPLTTVVVSDMRKPMKTPIQGTRLVWDNERMEAIIDHSIPPVACDCCHKEREELTHEGGLWTCATCSEKRTRRAILYKKTDRQMTKAEWKELHTLDMELGY